MADAVLSVELQALVRDYVAGMRTAASETRRTEGIVTKATKGISSAITSTFSGIFSVAAIAGFTREVIKVTAEFEKFRAVLGNTLGSNALADLKLKELQDFASQTPFSVQELTASFVKLANGGFKPTGDEMTRLGDLASSTGKSFDQLAEAILDAQTGEFERLKEFGVRAKDAGDKVIFTYKGVQTTVEKSSGAIRDYVTSLGSAEGVSGSMAKISETLGGKISNLGDSWDQMLLSVGSNTTGVFNTAIAAIGQAINKITEYNRELELNSKYDLGNGWSDMLQRFMKVIPSGAGMSTDLEVMSKALNGVSSGVNKYINKTISGAKSTADFGKALANLKIEADQTLSRVTNPGMVKALKDTYEKAFIAIKDARTAFGKGEAPDANFGTDKAKKGVKGLSDILKDLDMDLKLTEVQFKATFEETNLSKISAYQSAINSFTKLKMGASVNELKKLEEQLSKLFAAQKNLDQLGEMMVSGSANAGIGKNGLNNTPRTRQGKTEITNVVSSTQGVALKAITDEQEAILKSQIAFNEQFNSIVYSGLSDALGNLGFAMGEALASGGDVLSAAGMSILGAMSSFLSQFGKLLIEYGTAAVLKGKLDLAVSIPGAGIFAGAAAIAAGIALQMAAGAFNGLVNGSGKKGNDRSQRPTAFANGGIISGPTLGLMGEYAGAKSNPEVVAPLNKLKSMLGQDDDSQGGGYGKRDVIVLESRAEIDGDKLLIITKRAEARKNRS